MCWEWDRLDEAEVEGEVVEDIDGREVKSSAKDERRRCGVPGGD